MAKWIEKCSAFSYNKLKKRPEFSELISFWLSKLQFLCPANTLKKKTKLFNGKFTLLSICLGFEQIQFRSLANLFRHNCQNCFCTVQQTRRGKIFFLKKIQICSSFSHFERKKSMTSAENLGAGLSKLHFSCPGTYLKKNHFAEKYTFLSTFWPLSRKKFSF